MISFGFSYIRGDDIYINFRNEFDGYMGVWFSIFEIVD